MGIELSRGLAALMVMLTHYAAFIPGAPAGMQFLWTGVDLFFVISGYVFAPMILPMEGEATTTELRLHKSGSTHAYFLRRFFRIYPLYLLALIAYFIVLPEAPEKTPYFIRHLFFLHTTRSFEEAYYFNPAFWSLPVEIEFYLLLPLLALWRGNNRVMLAVAGGTLLLSLAANFLRGPGVDAWRVLSVHLPTILPEFLAGSLLALRVSKGHYRKLNWYSTQGLGALGLGIVLLVATYQVKYGSFGLENNQVLDSFWNLLCAISYSLVLYPLLLVRNEQYGWLASKVALTAGASSYGVYLLHNLMPRVLDPTWPASGIGFVFKCGLATLVAALVLYWIYENPLRKLGRTLGDRISNKESRD
jgi:exopolysaccharide production protein ExoZ